MPLESAHHHQPYFRPDPGQSAHPRSTKPPPSASPCSPSSIAPLFARIPQNLCSTCSRSGRFPASTRLTANPHHRHPIRPPYPCSVDEAMTVGARPPRPPLSGALSGQILAGIRPNLPCALISSDSAGHHRPPSSVSNHHPTLSCMVNAGSRPLRRTSQSHHGVRPSLGPPASAPARSGSNPVIAGVDILADRCVRFRDGLCPPPHARPPAASGGHASSAGWVGVVGGEGVMRNGSRRGRWNALCAPEEVDNEVIPLKGLQ